MEGFERLPQSIIMKRRVKRPAWVSSPALQGCRPTAHNSPVMNKHAPSMAFCWVSWFRVMIHRSICIAVMLFQVYIKLQKYHVMLWPQRWSRLLFLTDGVTCSGQVRGPVELIIVELGWMLATNQDPLPLQPCSVSDEVQGGCRRKAWTSLQSYVIHIASRTTVYSDSE